MAGEKTIARKAATRMTVAQRTQFLQHLAKSSNVAESARTAGIDGDLAYGERRRSVEFRQQWQEALNEGYARLEAGLLEEALQRASATISDEMLKARSAKNRLRLSLLSAHRASVKGQPPVPAKAEKPKLAVLKAELLVKLAQMRARAGIASDGSGPDAAAPEAAA